MKDPPEGDWEPRVFKSLQEFVDYFGEDTDWNWDRETGYAWREEIRVVSADGPDRTLDPKTVAKELEGLSRKPEGE